ncbi:hypothetical protein F5Y14DRAFT_455995 [Nemania sp. NC0429]|nr:hypothetical protein F5Y14DRAFT_455995 [Nemania sp. NC0429]
MRGTTFFDVNFWGVLAVTQAFMFMVIKSKGILLNHSFAVWNLAIAWGAHRKRPSSSSLTSVLGAELEPLGVRVATAVIGAIRKKHVLTTPISHEYGSFVIGAGDPAKRIIDDAWP